MFHYSGSSGFGGDERVGEYMRILCQFYGVSKIDSTRCSRVFLFQNGDTCLQLQHGLLHAHDHCLQCATLLQERTYRPQLSSIQKIFPNIPPRTAKRN